MLSSLISYQWVSIHASVKDATSTLLTLICTYSSFNPRICKRCDFKVRHMLALLLFQSTHLYKMRLSGLAITPSDIVSIHASVKDATDEDGKAYKVDFVSIHASVKDATQDRNIECTATQVSIHASVKDATKYGVQWQVYHEVSIHASVKDATPCL